ncbi:MAG: hypothetical protein H0W70_02200 [Actinobacteria bacterium]|nr:hypothetical protein [Actinomycetota bacterium]
MITAVEVIEHLENPISFLRNVHRILSPRGRAVVTSPRLEGLAARIQFARTGTLRLLDHRGIRPTSVPSFRTCSGVNISRAQACSS